MPGAQTRPRAPSKTRSRRRVRAAGYLRADHVELAVVLQLELDGLLPEGLTQRHHHHGGGEGGRLGPGYEGPGGLRQSRDSPSQKMPEPVNVGRTCPGFVQPPDSSPTLPQPKTRPS